MICACYVFSPQTIVLLKLSKLQSNALLNCTMCNDISGAILSLYRNSKMDVNDTLCIFFSVMTASLLAHLNLHISYQFSKMFYYQISLQCPCTILKKKISLMFAHIVCVNDLDRINTSNWMTKPYELY